MLQEAEQKESELANYNANVNAEENKIDGDNNYVVISMEEE